MRYMLDTNTCIRLIKNRPAQLLEILKQIDPNDICISSLTYAVLSYEIEKSSDVWRNRIALVLFLANIRVLPFDDRAACEYAVIRSESERMELHIGSPAAMIAAHARSAGCTVVTNNIREYKRVRNLRIENWV